MQTIIKNNQIIYKNSNLYKDITDKWLVNNGKSNKIILHNNFEIFKYKGKQYFIDNYNIVLDYKMGEIAFALWLSKNTNKRIELFPRFNKPDGFKTADYKIGKEYFDYKHTIGSSPQLIYHNLEKAKGQSVNFIINITNKKLSQEEIERQVNECFKRLTWIKKIGIQSQYNFKMYKKINQQP